MKRIKILYDDGRYQQFDMDVEGADGRPISVRSVRRCLDSRITFFQPKPPEFLRHHCGEWFVRSLDREITHLATVHRWNLSAPASAEESARVTRLLHEHAMFTMQNCKHIHEGKFV